MEKGLKMVPQIGHRLVTDWSQIGHRLVTDWTQTGHRMVTDWSQTGHSRYKWLQSGYKVVTKWSQSGHIVGNLDVVVDIVQTALFWSQIGNTDLNEFT